MSEYLNKRVMPFGRRTSAARAGVMEISLPHGARVAMLANLLAPDHDRGLWEAILRYLSFYKPHLIIFVGRIIHARVVNLLDPDAFPFSEDEAPLAPELKAALDSSNIWEERVGELFRILGESIFKRIVEAAGDQCRLYFLPALDGGSARDLPPEGLIQELLYRIQKKVDRNRARELRQKLRQKARRQEESDEPDAPEDEEIYPPIPMLRKEFAKLLQIDDHPQIDVLPFGSMIELKCQVGDPASASDDAARAACSKVLTDVRVEIGSRKVMHPIVMGYNTAILNDKPTILGFPANLANGFWTRFAPINALGRRNLFFSQIGMLFDRARVNFGDSLLERYCSGLWLGFNQAGTLHGKAFPFIRGDDGRRAAVVWSGIIEEEEPGGLGPVAREQIHL